MTGTHARKLLDENLSTIQDGILRMGSMVEEQIKRAVHVLKERDVNMARQVVEADDRVDQLRYRLEAECLRTIATQQPAARDLRRIIAAMHMAVDMERMADHATGIAEITIRMGGEPHIKPLIDIPRMQEVVVEMLNGVLDAYVKTDVALAQAVAKRDDEMDALYNQVLRELLTYMMADSKIVSRATYLLWVAHNLERIGDRVTNLCERVIFTATGELSDIQDSTAVGG